LSRYGRNQNQLQKAGYDLQSRAGVEFERHTANDDAASLHLPTSFRPPIHDANPLFPKIGTSLGTPHTVVIDMSQLTLDGVSIPHTAFI
jgi:hypothetical protein